MSLAIINSRAQLGVEAPEVAVEVHITGGLPRFHIVGLPEAAVRESRERVRSAIINSHFKFPNKRITVNLAPADLPKEGGRFDLPIAVGILVALGLFPADKLADLEMIGELALNGDLRHVSGAIPSSLRAKRSNRALIIPESAAQEAALVSDATVFAASTLLQVVAHLANEERLPVCEGPESSSREIDCYDLADIKGQHRARRALEVAAAGRHNLLMIGPPGTGKTMLASRIQSILPKMGETEALETATIYSISHQGFDFENWSMRPFRAPHHTASGVALVGGGSHPRPGEVSLAHNGVLFLDELPEFDRRVLEVLREPLESGQIIISRAARQAQFPARFQLIAAMNPCPCGTYMDSENECRCTPDQIQRYNARISGPFLDRVDLIVHVPRLTSSQRSGSGGESSKPVRARVNKAWNRQLARGRTNNTLNTPKDFINYVSMENKAFQVLEQACERFRLSERLRQRITRVARTIADLDASEHVCKQHVSEAISLRT